MNTTTEASKAAPATATLRLDQSVAKNLFFGEIVEENLFPYPVMRERDRELLGMMVDSIDRFLAGDATAISGSAKRGWVLYNSKALCVTCHAHVAASPLFTDAKYHNLGVAAKPAEFLALAKQLAERPADFEKLASAPGVEELGRFAVTRKPQDLGAFKTPHLRNIALTAPYMHDGSEATLAEVIEYYDRGGNKNPWLDPNMRPLGLTAQEKADLVALLETFTSSDLARFDELGKLMPK